MWQVCPVCKGRTWMPAVFYGSDKGGKMDCKTCKGRGVLRITDCPPRKPPRVLCDRDWGKEVAGPTGYFKDKDALLKKLEIVRRRLNKLEGRRVLDDFVGPGLGSW